jgi:hypothetical protein
MGKACVWVLGRHLDLGAEMAKLLMVRVWRLGRLKVWSSLDYEYLGFVYVDQGASKLVYV